MAEPDEAGKSLESNSQSDSAPTLAVGPTIDSSSSRPVALAVPQKCIGPYELVRKLGEGGMGQVWLAHQTAPLDREVALKLIKVGIFDDGVLQRFASERQALASMSHPCIAKVFDAGETPDGQPYFVMEYVRGLPITQYCDGKKLSIRKRLELFIKLCEGVQHAHQKAIIHRDLKPANILVVEVDGEATPRIIDFGLAKAVTSEAATAGEFTRMGGGWVGTPGFVSPEQADSLAQDVDTRTDVYALGAVLYLLLTGFIPVEANDKQTFEDYVRRLREEDPLLPSTKIGADKGSSEELARRRGAQTEQLASLLQGDLDWITMKALEKDRTRRYGTPSELAADVRRYLQNEPITARPASRTYRLGKYVRRHRAAVAVGAVFFVLLSGFAVMQSIQLRRITQERDRANRVTDFMTGMFKVSDPSESRGNTVTAREILDKASKDIDVSLAKDPELQARMMDVMGEVYDDLGLYHRAESLLGRAVEIRRQTLGVKNKETLASMTNLAWVLRNQGRFSDAEKLQRETLNSQRSVLGPDHPDTLRTQNDLAATLEREGKLAEAEKLHRETLDARRRVLGPEHRDTLASMHNLAGTLFDEQKFPEAGDLERKVLEGRQRVLGTEHPETLRAMHLLALILSEENRLPEAESLLQQSLDIERRVLGPDHPETLKTMDNFAALMLGEGRYSDAAKLERETLEIQHRVLGPDNPDAAAVEYNLACDLAHMNQKDEALTLLRHSLEHGMPVEGMAHLGEDSDLSSLHGDPRFEALVAEGKRRAAAAQK